MENKKNNCFNCCWLQGTHYCSYYATNNIADMNSDFCPNFISLKKDNQIKDDDMNQYYSCNNEDLNSSIPANTKTTAEIAAAYVKRQQKDKHFRKAECCNRCKYLDRSAYQCLNFNIQTNLYNTCDKFFEKGDTVTNNNSQQSIPDENELCSFLVNKEHDTWVPGFYLGKIKNTFIFKKDLNDPEHVFGAIDYERNVCKRFSKCINDILVKN